VADGASTPSGRSPPRPAQAGRAAAAKLRAGDADDPVVVLAGCTGCRSRREAPGPVVHAAGSSPPASCSEGEGVPEAGPRRQRRGYGGGLAVIPCLRTARWEGAGERALVEGRRPGFDEATVFDETAVEASLAAPTSGPGRKAGSRSRRAATEGVRGYAMGSVCGRELRCRVAPRGEALDRGLARTAQRSFPSSPASGATTPNARTLDAIGRAEAGGSPSSEAPPGDPREAFGQRWIGKRRNRTATARERPARPSAWESGSLLGCSYRRLVAEVGETHLSCRRREPRGNLGNAANGGIA